MSEVLKDRRFAIGLVGAIDLDDLVGGWFGVNRDGNGHLQGEVGRESHRRLLGLEGWAERYDCGAGRCGAD